MAGNHSDDSDEKVGLDKLKRSDGTPTTGEDSNPREPSTPRNYGADNTSQSGDNQPNQIDKQSKEYINLLEACLEVVEQELRLMTKYATGDKGVR